MSDRANRTFNVFTPARFGLLLAALIFASFPQVLLGLQSFVARDYGFFAYPLAHFQRDRFWHGEIPFWDPFNNCGVPFLAQWNTMPLYPLSLIYLALPLTWALSFFCLLHLWLGGFGMYFLARKWTGNDFAAAFAGTAFSFSGLTLNLLMWPSHTATWGWMPWVVLAVESAWRSGGRRIFIAVIVAAFQMLAGGPEIIFFTWLILLALWIQQWATKEVPLKTIWRFPVMVVLVGLLAAAQLLPFLDLAAHSQRQDGYADLRWSMPGRGWANYLVPMVFGSRLSENIFFQYNQSWTSSYYLGIGTLLLALVAVWKIRNRRVYLLAVVAGFAIIFALGGSTPIFPFLRKIFPQFGFVTYPVKYLLLVTFIAPLLAAYSLVQLRQQRFERHLASAGGILLLLIIGVLFWEWRFPLPNDDVHAAIVNGISRAGFLIATMIALLILTRKSGSNISNIGPLILIFLVWLDVLTHEPPQNPTVPPNVYALNLAREKLAMEPQPELGGARAMVSPKAYMEFIRMALPDAKNNFLAKRLGYCADANLLDAVPKVDGFFSLTTRENNDLFTLMYGTTNDFSGLEDFLGVSQKTAPGEIYEWQPRKTFLPLVTAGQQPVFLDDPNALHALTDSDFDGSKVVFLPPEARELVSATNRTDARIVNAKFGIQRADVDAEAPAAALVVIAQTYYHNWSASVDGSPAPLLRANYGFQAVPIPQGRHHIQLIYKDRAFEIGAVLSIASWLGCIVGWFTARPKAGQQSQNI